MMSMKLPSDLSQMLTVTRYEMYKFLRGKKIYVMLGLMALIIALMTAVPPMFGYDLPDTAKEFIVQYLTWVNTLVVIAVTIFSSGALASEFEERTGFLMFPRPIKRITMFTGKYLASFLVCGGCVLLYYLVSAVLSLVFTGSVYFETLYSFGLALLYILGASGLAFLFSGAMQKGSTAAIMTFASLFLILPIFVSVLSLVNTDPFFILSQAGDSIYNVIAGEVTTVLDMGPGMTFTVYYPETVTSVIVMAAWAVVTSAASLVLFNRREF